MAGHCALGDLPREQANYRGCQMKQVSLAGAVLRHALGARHASCGTEVPLIEDPQVTMRTLSHSDSVGQLAKSGLGRAQFLLCE